MGGFGSGRRATKPLAEEALKIDIGRMLRENRAVPNAMSRGELVWRYDKKLSASVGYLCDMQNQDAAWLELSFSIEASDGLSKRHTIQQRIPLSHTSLPYGGKRWWMHCPVDGARVAKLYLPYGGKKFAGRKAWRIVYSSQRLASWEKPFAAIYRLQERLGCPEDAEMPIIRPKGMWQRTFLEYREKYETLSVLCAEEIIRSEELLKPEG